MVVTRDVSIPLSEIVVRTSRSSGPGGQHANVTASRVEVSFDASGSPSLTDAQRERVMAKCGPAGGGPVVRAVAQDARSQARNRELAFERLRERLARALHVARTRRPTRPTKASRVRREHGKRRQAQRKRDRRRPATDD